MKSNIRNAPPPSSPPPPSLGGARVDHFTEGLYHNLKIRMFETNFYSRPDITPKRFCYFEIVIIGSRTFFRDLFKFRKIAFLHQLKTIRSILSSFVAITLAVLCLNIFSRKKQTRLARNVRKFEVFRDMLPVTSNFCCPRRQRGVT